MNHHLATITDAPIHVVFRVPDREALVSVLELLADAEVEVQTESISPARLSPQTSVSIDLDVLTEKQREALQLAVDRGYYRRPRDVTLTDLAADLDISKSAVSQRLRSAETKLLNDALERYRS